MLQEIPHVPAVQTAEPLDGTGHALPQVLQLLGSLTRFWHPLEHIVSPAGHAMQAVPAVLQPFGQVVVALLHI